MCSYTSCIQWRYSRQQADFWEWVPCNGFPANERETQKTDLKAREPLWSLSISLYIWNWAEANFWECVPCKYFPPTSYISLESLSKVSQFRCIYEIEQNANFWEAVPCNYFPPTSYISLESLSLARDWDSQERHSWVRPRMEKSHCGQQWSKLKTSKMRPMIRSSGTKWVQT